MSKGKLVIIIICLMVITGVSFWYFSAYKPVNTNIISEGTNFVSNFFPFGKSTSKTNTPTNTAVDLSGVDVNPPETVSEVASTESLQKVSILPVAGFGIFMKERFKEVPVVIPTPANPTLDINAPVEKTTTTETPEINKKDTKKATKPTPPPTEFVPIIKYVDRVTGNVFQTYADKIDNRQLTTTIIPRVHDAYFGKNGESVIMRYLKSDEKTIETFVGSLPKEVLGGDTITNTEIKGSFLPENITDISISPDSSKMFYLIDNGNSVTGITALTTGEKKVQVFSSPFTEWLSWWPNDQMITMSTKPSFRTPGYLYAINTSKKDFTKVLGEINGLTTLMSPNKNLVLYANNNLTLNIYNTQTGNVAQVGTKGLPEKCVWNKSSTAIYCSIPKQINGSQYPDSWYQGLNSFEDNIWKIDSITGNGSIISEMKTNGAEESIDGIKLALDDNENYLFFINKKDSSLWELKIN